MASYALDRMVDFSSSRCARQASLDVGAGFIPARKRPDSVVKPRNDDEAQDFKGSGALSLSRREREVFKVALPSILDITVKPGYDEEKYNAPENGGRRPAPIIPAGFAALYAALQDVMERFSSHRGRGGCESPAKLFLLFFFLIFSSFPSAEAVGHEYFHSLFALPILTRYGKHNAKPRINIHFIVSGKLNYIFEW